MIPWERFIDRRSFVYDQYEHALARANHLRNFHERKPRRAYAAPVEIGDGYHITDAMANAVADEELAPIGG